MRVDPDGTEPASPVRKRFVSIVVPCLNEELVIGEFVDWCFEGLKRAGVEGEVLIVDSSTDRSPEIAEAHGARVLRVPRRGLGQAYIDAMPHIRGDYVILGDCDLTYDFREIAPFLAKLDEGYEFVMGSRTKGFIQPGAMPALHRYFGTPLTTWILNTLYRSRWSDIHCGMRALTRDALKRIDILSPSWEYASEMILKAALLRLRSTEVPIRFYKDREGRTSHHKRAGWLSPWKAGWTNLKVMFLFAPDFFLAWPSVAMMLLGLTLVGALAVIQHPFRLGRLGFDLHWMLLGMTLTTLGYSAFHLALLAKAYHNFQKELCATVVRVFTYNRGMAAGGLLMLLGALLGARLLIYWVRGGLELPDLAYSYQAVLGLLLIVLGFQTITHTLIFHMVVSLRRREVDKS